jgi:hypothetical protein
MCSPSSSNTGESLPSFHQSPKQVSPTGSSRTDRFQATAFGFHSATMAAARQVPPHADAEPNEYQETYSHMQQAYFSLIAAFAQLIREHHRFHVPVTSEAELALVVQTVPKCSAMPLHPLSQFWEEVAAIAPVVDLEFSGADVTHITQKVMLEQILRSWAHKQRELGRASWSEPCPPRPEAEEDECQ